MLSKNNVIFTKSCFIIILFSTAALIAAFAFEYIGGLKPCSLCIYQRIPHGLAIALCIVTLVFKLSPPSVVWIFIILALTFLVGAGIALFHVGVEQQFWSGTQGCGSNIEATSVEAFRLKLLQQPIVRCDEIAWSLFGVSMAGYNLILSLGLSFIPAFAIFKWRNIKAQV